MIHQYTGLLTENNDVQDRPAHIGVRIGKEAGTWFPLIVLAGIWSRVPLDRKTPAGAPGQTR